MENDLITETSLLRHDYKFRTKDNKGTKQFTKSGVLQQLYKFISQTNSYHIETTTEKKREYIYVLHL